jgi:hypothetical protein
MIMKKSLIATLLFSTVMAQAQTAAPATKSMKWAIKKTEWSVTDEKNYQEFVKGIGNAVEQRICNTTEKCIKNKTANPRFYNMNPPKLNFFSDCADLPHILRAYFAWMNNLPFSFPAAVVKADPTDPKSDIRYTRGNKTSKVTAVKSGDDIKAVLTNVSNYISSAMFRIHPDQDLHGAGVYTDMYSPALNKDNIKPGTTVYDPNGHILVVYNILDDGRVLMIDAHPDNSLTRKVYGEAFIRSRPSNGSGFKNWRPIKLVGATADQNGIYYGGSLQATANKSIPSFSKEQYLGNQSGLVAITDANWNKGQFSVSGQVVGYYDYVRRVLAKGDLKYHPVDELRSMLQALCIDLKDRADAVNAALAVGVQNKAHPDRLPDNIYGTQGEWEEYSTPSRDARFKAATLEARTLIEQMVEKYHDRDPMVVYSGNDLAGDLRRVYAQESKCAISYKNSNGVAVNLTLDQVIDRMYALSFDPYHCSELRWGASGTEASSCKDSSTKRAWFTAEQNLRNAIDRNYEVRMDKTLSELPSSGLGTSQQKDLNVKKYLQNL